MDALDDHMETDRTQQTDTRPNNTHMSHTLRRTNKWKNPSIMNKINNIPIEMETARTTKIDQKNEGSDTSEYTKLVRVQTEATTQVSTSLSLSLSLSSPH